LRRVAAVTTESTGATKLWAGAFTVDAKAKTGPHHHGDLETVIYVLNGVARLRWGERLEFEAEANAGLSEPSELSEVPGLAKHVVTPHATNVRTRLSAPFMIESVHA